MPLSKKMGTFAVRMVFRCANAPVFYLCPFTRSGMLFFPSICSHQISKWRTIKRRRIEECARHLRKQVILFFLLLMRGPMPWHRGARGCGVSPHYLLLSVAPYLSLYMLYISIFLREQFWPLCGLSVLCADAQSVLWTIRKQIVLEPDVRQTNSHQRIRSLHCAVRGVYARSLDGATCKNQIRCRDARPDSPWFPESLSIQIRFLIERTICE